MFLVHNIWGKDKKRGVKVGDFYSGTYTPLEIVLDPDQSYFLISVFKIASLITTGYSLRKSCIHLFSR